MRIVTCGILAAAAISAAGAEQSCNEETPEGKVYVYKVENGVAREMEIHFPPGHDVSKGRVPGIIMFHGGGWNKGDRKSFRYLCHYFADRGLVAATVSYRLANREENGEVSRKRVCITDAKSAIRWYKQHADELGIDSKRIIAGGGSAGGHICLLATTNPGLNDPRDPEEYDTSVAAYLLFNPALSVGDDHFRDAEVDLRQHLRADLPPAIVFFGSEDNWLRRGWDPACEKMKSLGITSVEVWIAPGQGHSFYGRQPWYDITIAASDRFLGKLGLIKGEPTLAPPKTGECLVGRKEMTE